MKSHWSDQEANACGGDPLKLRVYTSRLIGREPDLVLHGGGNTSVKTRTTNAFGDSEDLLLIKGSGWDLGTIDAAGFAPVRLDTLRRMAELPALSDSEMVRMQRAAMVDPNAPTPSVEAILHAIIPFVYVDHTHADAVVTITNTPNGMQRIGEIYGDRIFIVPYVMPGFLLASEVYKMTQDIDWAEIEGMILLNHGVFTFGNDARSSYERMIEIVTEAEDYLQRNAPLSPPGTDAQREDLPGVARLRGACARAAGRGLVARLDSSLAAATFAARPDAAGVATRGPLTPDHVIRTKASALVIRDDITKDVEEYVRSYDAYFQTHNDGELTRLDPAPRWVVWPGHGIVTLGSSANDLAVVSDIVAHTIRAIERGEALGGWHPLAPEDLFDVEYWELEQAKLKRAGRRGEHEGKVALVTGAASGIGRACAEALREAGACVVGLDVDPVVVDVHRGPGALGMICDVSNASEVADAVSAVVRAFGGVDIVISNAGVFPPSAAIADGSSDTWDRSLTVNLTGHRNVLQKCIPYLELGIDPAVVFIGSKNVAAPGPGAGAYSVAKAGLTQLARVAALELAGAGIRVNVLHPNDVFDTGIWTEAVLAERAAHYGLSVEAYKKRNLLGVEVTSRDVAALASALAGKLFAKTTGAQIPVDGGNDRVV